MVIKKKKKKERKHLCATVTERTLGFAVDGLIGGQGTELDSAKKTGTRIQNKFHEKFHGERRGVPDPSAHPLGNTCSADAPLYGGCGEEMLKIGPLDAIFHMYCITPLSAQ